MSGFWIWAAVFFSTSFWVWALPVYNQSRPFYGIAALLAGLAAVFRVFYLEEKARGRERERPSLVKGAAGVLYYYFLLLACEGLGALVFIWLALYVHRVDILVTPCYWLLRFLGYDCSLSGGTLHVWNSQFLVPFSFNLEKVAFLPGLMTALGALPVIALSGGKKKRKQPCGHWGLSARFYLPALYS